MTTNRICSCLGTNAKILEKTIELLKRHDVIATEKGGIRIASELMRRWIYAKENRG
jgi:DNA-binding IscR family transcriptional regulator